LKKGEGVLLLKKPETTYFVTVRKSKGKNFYTEFYMPDALLIFLQDRWLSVNTDAFILRQVYAFI